MSKKTQPRRHRRVIIGKVLPTKYEKPSIATLFKSQQFIGKNPNTEIRYAPDGRVGEVVNHKGFLYKAGSPEQLMDILLGELQLRDLLDLDRKDAVTTMRYLSALPEAGNLGMAISSQQVHEDRTLHACKVTVNAIDNKDGTWSVWRIVNTTETLPVDTRAKLALTKEQAIEAAEKAVRKALKITDPNVRCELAEDEGGYIEQYNRPPNAKMLKPIQRIFLRLIAPGDTSLPVPLETIINHRGNAVYGRNLNCDLAAKAFLMEPTTGSIEEAAKQVRIVDIDPGKLRVDPKTGRRMLANAKVEIYFDPQDRGNANTILLAKEDGSGFVYELGSIEQAAVVAFIGLNRCVERHERTGSKPSDVIAKAYIGLEKLLGQRISDNAAYYPAARVMGFGIRIRGVVAKGRHLLVTYDVIYHEWGHKEHHEIQMQTGRRITGPFWAGMDEQLSDAYSLLFGTLDTLEEGERLGIEVTLESLLNEKGELATIAFGTPIRVMESMWTYPEGLDEGTEEHDIAEKMDAPYIHMVKAWIKGEYKKAIKPEMSASEMNATLRAVVTKMIFDLTTINKTLVRTLRENRPSAQDVLYTFKLIAKRNYGVEFEAYFHEGYTVQHKIPDGVSKAE